MNKQFLKKVGKAVITVSALAGFAVASHVSAGPTNGLSLTAVSTNIGHAVSHISVILSNVALIAGIGFVMASFFKFHQHKLNPTQVPLSQGVTLLLIGAGLTLFPIMIPTAKNVIAGSSSKVSEVSGSGMKALIGASS